VGFGNYKLFQKFVDFLNKRNFRKVLPLIYFFVLAIGGILTLVYAFVPKFTACSSLFGEEFCTPFGIMLMLAASLPGYIIAGNLLFFIIKDLHWAWSLMIVIVASTLIYYLIGLGLDKVKSRPMNPENISKVSIVVFFVILLLLVVVLL